MKALKCNNRIWKLGIVGALLLLLLLPLLLPGTASAAERVENTYAVVVTTGGDVGNGVTYFGLQYVDTDGYTHTEYVFPHEGDLRASLERASAGGDFADASALQRGQTDTYLFTPAYPVAEVTGLDIYCQGTQGELYGWDVSGLRLYRVDELLGTRACGSSYTLCFNGTQIAQLEERSANAGVSFSWTGNALFRLRAEDPSSHRLLFENIPYSMEGTHDYVVRMDIADVYGAGFELMNQPYDRSAGLGSAGFGECLAVQLEYLDVFGDPRLVRIPVMTTMVDWLLDQGVPASTRIAGLAQQGDTMAFGCCLWDMQKVLSMTLYTGEEARNVVSQPMTGTESASFTGVSIYRQSQVGVGVSTVENSADGPGFTFTADPLFYHTATSVLGEEVGADNSHYMTIYPYEPGAVLTPRAESEKYLIELVADRTSITGVPEDLTVQLQYVDMSGNTRRSEEVSVREAVREYYGYWPASTEDFAYVGQINSDEGVRFVMDLADVEHFTGLTVSLPGGTADWQMAAFRVVRLETLDKRACVWEDISAQGASSNRRYGRNAEGYLIFSMEEKALLQPDSSWEISFISQSVQEVQDIDWSDMRYAMSYEQCTSNLGLAKVRENYVVEVRVQSGTTTLDSYGDNGSKNRFYFLLEFENGVSGYVLANQQLGADGFRSGCTESFVVSTNYDYGELVAVRVIPDDISEQSDPYDKLNIDSIRVRRRDEGSISKEWVVENVGWIGIDYRDEGASASITGQQGRAEADVARVYPVSYSTYALNIEFRLGTGAYTDSGSGGSFYGTMEGTLEYYNAEGRRCQLTFDVIRAMYEYANKNPVYLDESAYSSSGVPLAISDSSFMFRENHTDRFIISVSDVARLSKLTLNIKSLNGGSLQITDLSAALVTQAGALQVNEQDEYVRLGTTEYLCSDNVDRVPAFELFLPTGRNIYQEIYFSDHESIRLDTENNTWISAVSRVPNSQNDTVNIYVYPAQNAMGRFGIDARVQYTDINGRLLETGAENLAASTTDDGRTVYSALGLGASGMSTLNKIIIEARSPEVVDAYIDYAVVQQVRSGVVINSFYIDCEHKNADTEFYAVPGGQSPAAGYEQKVYLSLGSGTVQANLVPESRDVAVALRYTNVNDTGEHEYTSAYIYLTDQQYQAVCAGDLVELTFREPYLDEVTGVQVATSGNVKVQVDMACVDSYHVSSDGTKTLQDHFSFAVGAAAQNNAVLLPVTASEAVHMLQASFVTAGADAYLESGTTAPIMMVVGYTDGQGVQREKIVADIRECVVSEGAAFATGSVTQIRLLLRDARQIRWLQLMPYDGDAQTTAGWKLSQASVALGVNGSLQSSTRSVGVYIEEDVEVDPENTTTAEMVGGHRVSFVSVVVKADVKATTASGLYGTSYRVNSSANPALSITAVPGGSVCIDNVAATNSELGYTVTAERVVSQSSAQDVSGLLQHSGDEIIFAVPEAAGVTYRITVVSKEQADISVEIEIVVPPAQDTSGGENEGTTGA